LNHLCNESSLARTLLTVDLSEASGDATTKAKVKTDYAGAECDGGYDLLFDEQLERANVIPPSRRFWSLLDEIPKEIARSLFVGPL
jgi:hypothetical protein